MKYELVSCQAVDILWAYYQVTDATIIVWEFGHYEFIVFSSFIRF